LLGTFDARVAEIALPALRRVEVRLLRPSSEAEDVAFWEGRKVLYVEALARLAARGVLAVTLG